MKYIAGFLSLFFGLVAFLFTLGCFMLSIGMTDSIEIPIVVEGTIEYSEIKWQLIGQDLGSIVIAILCIILFAYFYSLYHRLNKRKKDTLNKDDINGPFVLYLRSFKDDATTRKNTSFLTDTRSEEEVMVEVLTEIAPVYAIGDLCKAYAYVKLLRWYRLFSDSYNDYFTVQLYINLLSSQPLKPF